MVMMLLSWYPDELAATSKSMQQLAAAKQLQQF
jgi:hypothetical protein